ALLQRSDVVRQEYTAAVAGVARRDAADNRTSAWLSAAESLVRYYRIHRRALDVADDGGGEYTEADLDNSVDIDGEIIALEGDRLRLKQRILLLKARRHRLR